MRRFVFSPYVEDDLREIRDYIAQDSPDSARRLMLRFLEAFRLLARHPELGHRREDLLAAEMLFWPVGAYLVLYLPEHGHVNIIAVLHGGRDVPAIINRRAQ